MSRAPGDSEHVSPAAKTLNADASFESPYAANVGE